MNEEINHTASYTSVALASQGIFPLASWHFPSKVIPSAASTAELKFNYDSLS